MKSKMDQRDPRPLTYKPDQIVNIILNKPRPLLRGLFFLHTEGLNVKKLFIGSLPATSTEETVQTLFAEYGKVHSIKLVKDLFSGQCKGFGFLEMEGHEARAAIAGLDGKPYEGNALKVKFEDETKKTQRGKRR